MSIVCSVILQICKWQENSVHEITETMCSFEITFHLCVCGCMLCTRLVKHMLPYCGSTGHRVTNCETVWGVGKRLMRKHGAVQTMWISGQWQPFIQCTEMHVFLQTQ